ncbi:MAG: SDR family oxidoreductase [Pseudomonadales bacterium]
MKVDFKHKVVVVTGATGGIGRALSWRFASAGARIVLVDVDDEQLPVVQNQIERSGADVLSINCDISDFEQCQSAMQQVIEHFGGIDLLINNAGVSHCSSFEHTDLAVFEKVMAVNYFGALHCTKAALNSLIERRGMIITLSSTGGFAPMIGRVGYSASKHALHGLFESLRVELKEKGVHVMIVCPGATATEMHKSMLAGDGHITSIPVSPDKKLASPQELADAIFDGAQHHKRIVIHSKMSKTSWFYWKFFPSLFERKLYKQWRSELGL